MWGVQNWLTEKMAKFCRPPDRQPELCQRHPPAHFFQNRDGLKGNQGGSPLPPNGRDRRRVVERQSPLKKLSITADSNFNIAKMRFLLAICKDPLLALTGREHLLLGPHELAVMFSSLQGVEQGTQHWE